MVKEDFGKVFKLYLANFRWLACLFLLVTLGACNTTKAFLLTEGSGEEKVELPDLDYGNVLIQDKSEYVIIPVGYKLNPGKRIVDSISNPSYSANFSVSQSTFSGWSSISVSNLIFHGKKNNETRLLLDKNAYIAQFDYLVNSTSNNSNRKNYQGFNSCQLPKKLAEAKNFEQLFIYRIIQQDTNRNKVLDNKDADRGYLSDLSGKKLRPITPVNTKLVQWECDVQRNQLVLFVLEDSNGDRKYEQNGSKDALALYLYDLSTNKLTRITVPKSHLVQRQIYFEDDLIFFQTKLDSDQDGEFTVKDLTQVTKFSLSSQEKVEINNPDIRQILEAK